MSLVSHTVLAFSMSADAFAASVAKGAVLHRPRFGMAVRIGLVFGIIETITPVIGWLLGRAASPFIASVDHWVAFAILTLVGGRMIWEGAHNGPAERREAHTLGVLILTAIGTSIDAMAVGATLALLDTNIWLIAAMIGAATFLMATIGILTGHYIGAKAGKAAEILAGLCLIAIGAKILAEHLG